MDFGLSEEQEMIVQTVRSFVENGGSIYASDWAHPFVEFAFPEQIDFLGADNDYVDAQRGYDDFLYADVSDSVMQTILSSGTAEIRYDFSEWVVAKKVSTDVDVLLRATVQAYKPNGSLKTLPDAPLAVRFQVGEGRVVYATDRAEIDALESRRTS